MVVVNNKLVVKTKFKQNVTFKAARLGFALAT